MFIDLNRVIEQVGKDKGIDKAVLIDAIESAMLSAAKKKFGIEKEIEARFNEEVGEVELFEFKTVAEKVEDPSSQISFQEASKLDPECQLGDSLGVKMDISGFGRISAQMAKQVIIQKVRDAEREVIYNEFTQRQGEIVNGIVRRFERGNLVVDLGRTEAILPPREQIPGERFRVGDRVRAYVLEIEKATRGPQIILSRSSSDFLKKLFEVEVPEIYEKIVEIKVAAREPGGRAKIAVASSDSDVDPVGACVGVKGSRVQSVVQELRGEKIDIVPWSSDPAKLVCNALAPAEVAEVVMDEASKSMEVIVPDEQLSLAIGRKGQNVRLAVQLTGWNIDIQSESKVKEQVDKAKTDFCQIEEVDDKFAGLLFSQGYHSLGDLSKAKVEDLRILPGVGLEKAQRIVEGAAKLLAIQTTQTPEVCVESSVSESSSKSSSDV
ncbi:MAG: transcription termination/antitermination protein NusA [Deltaproteobacteria bacterium]|nr:transcription termination/antitermination protein NusA [Deltaproteobacteria bacterium]